MDVDISVAFGGKLFRPTLADERLGFGEGRRFLGGGLFLLYVAGGDVLPVWLLYFFCCCEEKASSRFTNSCGLTSSTWVASDH